jgi:hypothetical protein
MNGDGLRITSSEKTIQEHIRHYYTDLHSGKEIAVSTLFETYRLSHPSLHKYTDLPQTDVTVLSYCLPRLPDCIFKIKKIIISQSTKLLKTQGVDISSWEPVIAVARRRQSYFDKITQTMAVIITSDSDIDDLINCLISFQLEREKFSRLSPNDLNQVLNSDNHQLLGIEQKDWVKLKSKLGPGWKEYLNLYSQYYDISIQSAPNDDSLYNSIASTWWQKICTGSLIFEFAHTPIYFVSSNLHSFPNLIGGFVNQRQDQIIAYIEKSHPDLYLEWQNLKAGQNQLRVIDFLYYISSRYFADLQKEQIAKTNFEESLGIRTINSQTELSCTAQLIPVSAIVKSNYRDPNLVIRDQDKLMNSRAYILNIDYPLGFTAYYIFHELLSTLDQLKGAYIIGKAAILSGAVGDIQIPKIVFDERTNNIFYPNNIFNNNFPFTAFKSSILRDQKSISVYGTFLENKPQLDNYIDSGFNVIEMESGPYLSAIYQHNQNLGEIPRNTVAHLDNLPYELGLINYASDNPLSQNMGEGNLTLKGIEPTYLAALSVVQRVIDLESI